MSRHSTIMRTRYVVGVLLALCLWLTLKIWALAVSSDEKTIVSAGADSVATFWEDSTEVEQEEKNDALIKSVQR